MFKVQYVQYLKGPPSHVTLPFDYRTPILSDIQMNLVFRCLVIRWLLFYFLMWSPSGDIFSDHLLGSILHLTFLHGYTVDNGAISYLIAFDTILHGL